MSGEPTRVLLVDDSADQRAGYKMLLGSQPDLVVVGQAADGAQALGILRREKVDVVLMAVQMPRVNGLVAAARILDDPQVLSLGRPPRLVLLATVDLDDHVAAAAVSGAFAILYKDVDPEALFDVIRDAASSRGEF